MRKELEKNLELLFNDVRTSVGLDPKPIDLKDKKETIEDIYTEIYSNDKPTNQIRGHEYAKRIISASDRNLNSTLDRIDRAYHSKPVAETKIFLRKIKNLFR